MVICLTFCLILVRLALAWQEPRRSGDRRIDGIHPVVVWNERRLRMQALAIIELVNACQKWASYDQSDVSSASQVGNCRFQRWKQFAQVLDEPPLCVIWTATLTSWSA